MVNKCVDGNDGCGTICVTAVLCKRQTESNSNWPNSFSSNDGKDGIGGRIEFVVPEFSIPSIGIGGRLIVGVFSCF